MLFGVQPECMVVQRHAYKTIAFKTIYVHIHKHAQYGILGSAAILINYSLSKYYTAMNADRKCSIL